MQIRGPRLTRFRDGLSCLVLELGKIIEVSEASHTLTVAWELSVGVSNMMLTRARRQVSVSAYGEGNKQEEDIEPSGILQVLVCDALIRCRGVTTTHLHRPDAVLPAAAPCPGRSTGSG